MTIIIDGPDGVGKSTLVKRLKEHYNIDSIRLTYKDPKNFNFYSQLLEKTECIFDRHFLSEFVYASIFNRQCELSTDDIEKLYDKTNKLNIKILLLDADTEEILRRIAIRGNEFKEVINNISLLRERFKYLSDLLGIEIIDTSKLSFEEIIRKVDENEKNRNNIIK